MHTREFPFGKATVFYPDASEESCTAAVLLDVDPVGMVRGRGGKGGAEDQYVNDRPVRRLVAALSCAFALVQLRLGWSM